MSESQLGKLLAALDFDSTMDTDFAKAEEWLKSRPCIQVMCGNRWTDAVGPTSTVKLDLLGGLAATAVVASDVAEVKRASAKDEWAISKANVAVLALSLWKLKKELQNNAKLLAQLAAAESGRRLPECEKDVQYLIDAASFCGEHAGFRVPNSTPVGLTAVVADQYNILEILADGVLPALTVGNPVLLVANVKCRGVLAAAAFAEMVRQADFPGSDALNFCVVDSGAEEKLFSDPAPPKVCYFGSVERGRKLRELGAESVSRVSVYAGGVVAVVHASGFVHTSVDAFVAAVTRSNRKGDWWHVAAFVCEPDFDDFWRLAREKVAKLRVGLDFAADDAPSASVMAHLNERKSKGNETLVVGPYALACDRSSVVRCPVADGGFGLVLPFKSSKDCLALTRELPGPLAVSVHGSRELAHFVKFGTVWVDCFGARRPDLAASRFGASGNGVSGGRVGLVEFLVPRGEEIARQHWTRMDGLAAEVGSRYGREAGSAELEAALGGARKAAAWSAVEDAARRDLVQKVVLELLEKSDELEPFFPETFNDSMQAVMTQCPPRGLLEFPAFANSALVCSSRMRGCRTVGIVSCHEDWLAVYVRVVLPLLRAGNRVVFAAPADACAVFGSALGDKVPGLPAGALRLVPGGSLPGVGARMARADGGLDAVVCLGASPASNVTDFVAAEASREVKVLMPSCVPEWEFLVSIAYEHTAVLERVITTFEKLEA